MTAPDPAPSATDAEWFRLTVTLSEARRQPISASLRTISEKHSMLHPDVLILLHHFSRTLPGAVLEIGAYLGGSTIALAWGRRDAGASKKSLVTIEPGGELLEHHSLPSRDILRDLKENLEKRQATDWVTLVEGYSWDEKTLRRVGRYLPAAGVDLFFIDADGDVDRDLNLYADRLRPGGVLVVDDYLGSASEKTNVTRAQIDARVRGGTLTPLGVFGWGTWFGRWKG